MAKKSTTLEFPLPPRQPNTPAYIWHVVAAAAKRGVEVIAIRGGQPRQGLQLGFAAVDGREIDRGLVELRRILIGKQS